MDGWHLVAWYAWFLLTAVGGCVSFFVSLWYLRKRDLRYFIKFAGSGFALFLLNPFINLLLFKSHRDSVVTSMRSQIGATIGSFEANYGKATSLEDRSGRQIRRYSPGPWYVLTPWEEVLVEVKGNRIVGTWIDD